MGSAGEYAFSHDIIRETTYDLAAGERRRLHEAGARALEENGGRSLDRLGALAHHWREADVPLLPARSASEAARVASTSAAPTDALHYAAAACELYVRALGVGATTEDLRQARFALAETALTCGDYVQVGIRLSPGSWLMRKSEEIVNSTAGCGHDSASTSAAANDLRRRLPVCETPSKSSRTIQTTGVSSPGCSSSSPVWRD